MLHSPNYRESYKEFLKIDFPRVPYPKDAKTFLELGKLGAELRKLHLLESPKVEQYITQYPIDGDNNVTKPIYKDGQLNIVFNDNKKNKGITDIDEIKNLGNYNNAVPTLFRFDDKGKITRFDPEDVIKNELVIRPGVFYRKSDNELLIYASRKKSDKLGRVIIQ